METLYNGFTLQIAPGAFPFGTDSTVLADFARLPRQARVLDLGSGCGTIGILLCAKDSGCNVTGIELDPKAHAMALKNRDANALGSRLASICGDLTRIAELVPQDSFDICVSNPPYFSSGFLSKTTPLARHEEACTLDALFASAAYALRYGGDFYLVHKPERLAELFHTACIHKLEPKRLRLLRHRENGPVTLVLVQCRKGGKPGLLWEEVALYDAKGQCSQYYKELYHL